MRTSLLVVAVGLEFLIVPLNSSLGTSTPCNRSFFGSVCVYNRILIVQTIFY